MLPELQVVCQIFYHPLTQLFDKLQNKIDTIFGSTCLHADIHYGLVSVANIILLFNILSISIMLT